MVNQSTARARPAARRSNFWRSVSVILGGTVLGQVISVITLPIIARLYPPEAFGEYAVLVSASSVLTIVVSFGLSSAIMAPGDDDAAEGVVVVTFSSAVVLATVLAGGVVALQPALHWPTLGLPMWQVCLWVYFMTIVGTLSALLRVYVNRRGFNRALAINSVLSALSTLVIAIPLGFWTHGSLGLIIAGLVASVLSSAQMLHHANPFRQRLSLRTAVDTLRNYRHYVCYQYPANLMETVAAQLPTQVLGALYGSARLGSYSMNERLLGIPLRLVGVPLSVVYFRTSSESYRAGGSLAPLTFSIVSRVMAAAFGPMVILIFWGPDLFSWALGAKWREAGTLAGYLVPLYVLTLARASISNCRVVIGQQRINAELSLARLIIVLVSLIAGHAWCGTLAGAIFALSVGSSTFMVIDMAINFALLKSHLKRYLALIAAFSVGVVILWWTAGVLAPFVT